MPLTKTSMCIATQDQVNITRYYKLLMKVLALSGWLVDLFVRLLTQHFGGGQGGLTDRSCVVGIEVC